LLCCFKTLSQIKNGAAGFIISKQGGIGKQTKA
jgi:hypothetical protein